MDRRNICPSCGADYGNVQMYPVKLEVPPCESDIDVVNDMNLRLRACDTYTRDALKEC